MSPMYSLGPWIQGMDSKLDLIGSPLDWPAAADGQTGWPWTLEECVERNVPVNGTAWPRISIITPSYNQAPFIEQTIRSVLGQGYPNLEYVIIDGGSTDGTVEILRKYAPFLTYWVSEKDRGQAHAINKGLEHVTGDLIAYLNSDDYYLPGALWAVAVHFSKRPELDLVHGICRYVTTAGEPIGTQAATITTYEELLDLWEVWWKRRQFVQPEVFWSARIMRKVGRFREDLHFVMDYEYWTRILRAGGRVGHLARELTCFRFTPTQKSNQSARSVDEMLGVVGALIWDSDSPLRPGKRLDLKGKWLYHRVFLRAVDAAVAQGNCTLLRWLKQLFCLLCHPQILLASGFQERVWNRVLDLSRARALWAHVSPR